MSNLDYRFSLEISNLSKKFGNFFAIENISFSLPSSGIVGLIGTNGAGKTTLLGMIMGLITPSEGTINIFGKNLKNHEYEILKNINFESPYIDLPKRLSVFENLIFYARLYGIKKPTEKVKRLSSALKIDSYLDRRFGSLSAGQKTKVGLCKSLINDPKLLLLDEPTASLDPATSIFIREFLKSYQNEKKNTIFITSHNLIEVEQICQRIILLNKGKIEMDDTPKNLLNKSKYNSLENLFISMN